MRKRDGEGEARYDIVLEETKVVREMFQWVGIEGLSLRDVARRLQERGVATARGKQRWDPGTVRGLLRHSAYMGTAKYGKSKLVPRPAGRRPARGAPAVPRREKVHRPTAPQDQDPIPVPALISEELFQAVAQRLDENLRRQRERKSGASFLLSGLLVCQCCGSAYCGRTIRGKSRKSTYKYYRCLGADKHRLGGDEICKNKGVNGALLEASVWSDVCSLLRDPERLRRELERRMERQPDASFDASERAQSIAALKRRLARLLDAYEHGWLEKVEFEARMSRVKERLDREQKSYAEWQSESAGLEELRVAAGEFQTFAEQIASGLEEADLAVRRNIIKLLITRIEICEDEVRIVYKVEPRPFVVRPARGVLQHCVRSGETPAGKPRASFRPVNYTVISLNLATLGLAPVESTIRLASRR